MKKYLLLCLAFVGMLLMMSCSNEENENVPQIYGFKNVDLNCQTVRQLQAYNDAIMKDIKVTRFSTGNKLVDADIMGGIYGLGIGESIGSLGKFFGVWGWGAYGTCTAAGALVGAGAFSWKYYKRTHNCAITQFMTNQLYEKLTDYCSNTFRIVNYTFVNDEQTDSIFNQLQIPDGYEEIEKIGIAHNIVLQDDDSQLLLSFGDGLNGGGIGAPIGDDIPCEPELNPCAVQLFADSVFIDSYDDGLDMVDYYTIGGEFSYSDYLNDYPLLTTNATNVMLLFMSALHNIPQTTSNVIQLVNDYIETIEMNNELTTAEREQLYTGFIIAVYSFDLWNGNPILL